MHYAQCMGEGRRKKCCFVVSGASDNLTGLHWGSRGEDFPPGFPRKAHPHGKAFLLGHLGTPACDWGCGMCKARELAQ